MSTTIFSKAIASNSDESIKTIDKLQIASDRKIIDLTLGYYLNEHKNTGFSILPSIPTNYNQPPSLAILGNARYCSAVSYLLNSGYLPPHVSVQTLGSTGALSLALSLIKQYEQCQRIWVTELSWNNYQNIAHSIGLDYKTYPYSWDIQGHLNLDAMLTGLSAMQDNDALIIQGCCHNPTGIDLSFEQLKKIIIFAKRKKVKIIIDFAYFGLAKSIK